MQLEKVFLRTTCPRPLDDSAVRAKIADFPREINATRAQMYSIVAGGLGVSS